MSGIPIVALVKKIGSDGTAFSAIHNTRCWHPDLCKRNAHAYVRRYVSMSLAWCRWFCSTPQSDTAMQMIFCTGTRTMAISSKSTPARDAQHSCESVQRFQCAFFFSAAAESRHQHEFYKATNQNTSSIFILYTCSTRKIRPFPGKSECKMLHHIQTVTTVLQNA